MILDIMSGKQSEATIADTNFCFVAQLGDADFMSRAVSAKDLNTKSVLY